jgi:hypothetical protein
VVGRPRSRKSKTRRRPEMQTVKTTVRYARFLVGSLASVAFGINYN